MAGIPSHLYRRLQALLLRSEAFESNAALRTLFVDQRLAPWRNQVPEATNRQGRVQALIAFLADRYNVQGQNALVLLLRVLRERVDPGDRLHHDLDTLAEALSAALRDEELPAPPSIEGQVPPAQQITIIGDGNIIGDHSSSHVVQGAAGTPVKPPLTAVTTAALRRRLQRLDSVEIETLCLDHFPAVYDKFGRGLRRDEMINLLLDHCRRRPEEGARLGALLE
jgi:hypothetical protein